jgi:hypothetical protein
LCLKLKKSKRISNCKNYYPFKLYLVIKLKTTLNLKDEKWEKISIEVDWIHP